jgi:hypothetical protein
VVYDRNSAYEWLQTARRAARQVVFEGIPWLVYELAPAPFDRRNTTSLVFETENTVRRVRTFPAGWRDLSDDALVALSWSH